MKNKAIQFLRELPKQKEEQFNIAFNLLSKTSGVNPVALRNYNVKGATESNIANIIYDLKKYLNITEVEILSKPKKQQIVPDKVIVLPPTLDSDKPKRNLSEEFPFLTRENCPPELHIVSGALVASWKRYNEAHALLEQIRSKEIEVTADEDKEITERASSEFNLNHALIKELEHYRDNEKVLGHVGILKEYRMKKEVEAMSTEAMVKFRTNTPSYLSKNKTALEKEQDPAKKEKIAERITEREMRLELINAKLGIVEK